MEFLLGIVDGATATSRRWTKVEAATDDDGREEGTKASAKEDDDDDAARRAAARATVDVRVMMNDRTFVALRCSVLWKNEMIFFRK